MPRGIDLTNQFLIAMPNMVDPMFSGALIVLCEHGPKGALGLVVNRPTDLTLRTLFARMDLALEIAPWAGAPVYFGGPVQTDHGFVLHAPLGDYGSTLTVSDQLGLTTSRDVLEAIAGGEGPERALVALGYAGWEAGQLEEELAENAWLSVGADPAIIFETGADERFDAAMRLLGFDPLMLSASVGHG